VSWSKAGLRKFNHLSEMVKQQRAMEEETAKIEEDLTTWCRSQAQMCPVQRVENEVDPVTNSVMEEEDEVEAVGECDIFEV
jgi:hypothetical protein